MQRANSAPQPTGQAWFKNGGFVVTQAKGSPPSFGSVALAAEASIPVSWAYEGLRCQS